MLCALARLVAPRSLLDVSTLRYAAAALGLTPEGDSPVGSADRGPLRRSPSSSVSPGPTEAVARPGSPRASAASDVRAQGAPRSGERARYKPSSAAPRSRFPFPESLELCGTGIRNRPSYPHLDASATSASISNSANAHYAESVEQVTLAEPSWIADAADRWSKEQERKSGGAMSPVRSFPEVNAHIERRYKKFSEASLTRSSSVLAGTFTSPRSLPGSRLHGGYIPDIPHSCELNTSEFPTARTGSAQTARSPEKRPATETSRRQ
jgi:hypothetical protein